MPSRQPGRDPLPAEPQAEYNPLQMEGLRVADPVEQLLEEMVEETKPRSLNYGTNMRGRIAVITGGATGIGRAIALEFARHGVHVAFNYFSYDGGREILDEADETAREISQMEVKCHHDLCDVREPRMVDRFVGDAVEKLGGAHILVNNAGIARDQLMMRMKRADWDAVIATNLTAAYSCTQAVLRPMIKQRGGRIITISSVVGQMGNAGQVNYAASKAGLIGMAKALAREVASRGITVNVVAPGLIDTDMTRALAAGTSETWALQIPLGRLGTPEDVANAVCFLASEEAAYITGQVIAVNGGMYT
jgi:3-oxoacyl-[acyl-carrier protein] reductase